MLHEALLASELLAARGFGLSVVNVPWLNRIDASWLAGVLDRHRQVFVVEDHAPVGALGDHLLAVLAAHDLTGGRTVRTYGVSGFPAFGTPAEALRHHRLDAESLSRRILAECGTEAAPAGTRTDM